MTHTREMRILSSFERGGKALGLLVLITMLATGCGSFFSTTVETGGEAKTLDTTLGPDNNFGKDPSPVAGEPEAMANLLVVVIRGTSRPLSVEDTSSMALAAGSEPSSLMAIPV